ncbi:MAG: hypothetical protein AUG51_19830, partial [Acidobacteria bacterium 13_1_20CM_3_53_8]
HGWLEYPERDDPWYHPNTGFTGTDSLVYQICDSYGGCATATVTITVYNNPPVAVDDRFNATPPTTNLGNVLLNDYDPDNDPFNSYSVIIPPAHGRLDPDPWYNPDPGYSGPDSYVYQICDTFNVCATATVYINDDDANAGAVSCNSRAGLPINVTNGNMYLQQTDYQLPGVGESLDVTRTYNSNSMHVNLFGRGWTTDYDEAIKSFDSSKLELYLPDGRGVDFSRPYTTGAYNPVQGDFHAQIVNSADGGFVLTFKDGRVHRFNKNGKLLSLTDINNNQTTLTYNADGSLASITNPTGRVLTLVSNAQGHVTSISDQMGTIASYTYGTSNELLSVTYADNSKYQFDYSTINSNLLLASVTDALGNILEAHTYDSQGRALTSERQGGVERVTLNYISSTETDVTDALGHVTKYFLDKSKGRNVVTQIEGTCGCGNSQVQTWTYDNQLNVTSKTDALNHTITFTYDTNGNRLTETDATGTVTNTYNQFGEVLTSTDQLNGVTTNTYDAQGNLLTTRDALNNTTTFTYNTRGQMLTATDARGKVTTFTYDASGNLSQRKDANNISTFYFYDARSRLTSAQDPLGRSTLYAYDAAGRVNKVTHPDSSFVSFTYDLAGRRVAVTDERGDSTNFAYDSAYHMTSVTDALGHSTSSGYDVMSNLVSMTDALSRVTNYDYDDFNRPVKITYPPATTGATRLFETVTYDAAGNVTARTDTAGRVTHYAYDNVNRMTSTTDADNKTTGFEYDALSRTTAVVDALNQRYQFAYDAVSRQTQVTRGNVSMSYAYDVVGNRTQRTDYNGTVTTYVYDNLNRLKTITYPTRTVTYAYTSASQLSRATNENGSVFFGYDNRYRLSSVTDPFNYAVSYGYDTVGNRTRISLNSVTYATYTYDTVNRLTNLADSSNQNFPHGYDEANRLTSRTAPNGVVTSYAYDGLDRLSSLTHTAGATTLISNQYQYNDASNITNWANASGNHAYNYDTVNRLTSATNNGQPGENYVYDSVGNRASSHLSASYQYQPFNKLTNTASASYSYDANGNLLSKTDGTGTTTYSWNEENQLKQVSLPNGLIINYKYDALGRRIQRTTSSGANERYVYDGSDVLIDLNANGSIATTYLNDLGIDNHLRQTSSTTGVSYYLTDHQGSTAGLTDSSGNIVEQLSYDSFGNSTASTRTRYSYTGREWDGDAQLYYYRARFYDPQLSRFISEDPIGFNGGVNWYAYVENNSINTIDPSGHDGFGVDRVPPRRHRPTGGAPPTRPIIEPPPPTQPPPPTPTASPTPSPGGPSGPSYPPTECDCETAIPRLPDFWTFSGSVPLPGPVPNVGVNVSITIDRNWHGYIAAGPTAGIGYGGVGGASFTGGWIWQRCKPNERELHDFLTGWSIGGSGYVPLANPIVGAGGGANYSPSTGKWGAHAGLGSPGASGSVTGGWELW